MKKRCGNFDVIFVVRWSGLYNESQGVQVSLPSFSKHSKVSIVDGILIGQ